MAYGNEPTKTPDIDGQGRAWRVSGKGDGSAGVGSDWLVHAPYGHLLWWWYMVSAVHLRPQEGVDEPNINRPGATHEIIVLSLNPEKPLPDVDDWKAMSYLTPPDLCWQFIVNDDKQAKELGDLVVRHICNGMSPDSDFRSYWEGAVEKTAEHLRTGGHHDRPA